MFLHHSRVYLNTSKRYIIVNSFSFSDLIVVAGVTNTSDTTNIQEFTLKRKLEYPGRFEIRFFYSLSANVELIRTILLRLCLFLQMIVYKNKFKSRLISFH